MNHIKLTLAITLTALAFLCACDDSNSASADTANTPANEETNTQTQSDVFSMQENFTYMFYADETNCEWVPYITDMQFNFGPESSVTITTKNAEGTTTDSGVYRQTTDDDGYEYYMIQVKDAIGETINYYPSAAAYVITEKSVVYLTASENAVKELETEVCSK